MAKSEIQNVSAGDKAIAVAKLGTATNAQFVKALWSVRGAVLMKNPMPLFGYPVEVTRSKLIDTLRALPADRPCTLRLIPGAHAAEWFIAEGTAPAPKAKKPAKADKGTRAPKEPALSGEPGTAPDGDKPATGEPGTGE